MSTQAPADALGAFARLAAELDTAEGGTRFRDFGGEMAAWQEQVQGEHPLCGQLRASSRRIDGATFVVIVCPAHGEVRGPAWPERRR